jgi:hypothetical protein
VQSHGWPRERDCGAPTAGQRALVRSPTFVCRSARSGGPAARRGRSSVGDIGRGGQMLIVKAQRKCVRQWRPAAHLAGS